MVSNPGGHRLGARVALLEGRVRVGEVVVHEVQGDRMRQVPTFQEKPLANRVNRRMPIAS